MSGISKIILCTKCNTNKDISCFNRCSRNKSGLQSWCKDCKNSLRRSNRYTIINDGKKRCYMCNQIKEMKNFGISRRNNDGRRDECKLCRILYYRNNIVRIKKQRKSYYEENKEKVLARNKKYFKRRRLYDPQFRISVNLRRRVNKIVRGYKKNGSAINDLGCTLDQLKMHLESKFHCNKVTGEMMTWDNYGRNGWHIDHIKPLCSFDLTDRDQFLSACHYSNLQPLWAKDNLIKGGK